MKNQQDSIVVDFFPIAQQSVPKLYAYKLDVPRDQLWTVGGKLSYRFRGSLGGHWVFSNNRLVTDRKPGQDSLVKAVENAWECQSDTYQNLRGVSCDSSWICDELTKARFVAHSLIDDARSQIRSILKPESVDLGNAYIKRRCEIRPWLVRNEAAISIEIYSSLVHKQDFDQHTRKVSNPHDTIGIWVSDKNSTLKGEVIDIVGTLGDNRNRLLRLTQNPSSEDIIKESPDDTLVVTVGRKQYDYAATCLDIILRQEDYQRFGIDGSRANKSLRIAPKHRNQMISKIAALLRLEQLIGFEYDSENNSDLFTNAGMLKYETRIRFGDNATIGHDHRLISKLQKHGLYRIASDFEDDSTVKLAVLDAIGRPGTDAFFADLSDMLEGIGFTLDIVSREMVETCSRYEQERCIDTMGGDDPDIVVGLFQPHTGYQSFKSLTIGRGIPSQVVTGRTLRNKYALGNIALGILGKTGNIPYVLANPLEYADMIVGIDVAREKKKRLSGTVNIAAIARIYFNNGEFVRYVIHDEPLEGETIPVEVLQSMFSTNEFGGKRVIVHRDGYLRGLERDTLLKWGEEIDAKIYPVEVLKTGSPRMYRVPEVVHPAKNVSMPKKGDAFKISNKEAIFTSTLPPFKGATPNPLRIITQSDLSIERSVHSVLALTLLHYGSERLPRLPVTIHYSDKIASLALRGIKPRKLEGSVPYWL